MKKIRFEKKLDLKKETVVKLDDSKMNRINGGYLAFSKKPMCSDNSCVEC